MNREWVVFLPVRGAFLKALSVLLILVAVSGCASYPDYSEPLTVHFKSTGWVNPDIAGNSSPVVVRLFLLDRAQRFERADFFSLYQDAEETLGKDLVAVEELMVRPAVYTEHRLSLEGEPDFIGAIAAFRDLPNAVWRVLVPLETLESNEFALRIDRLTLERVGDIGSL